MRGAAREMRAFAILPLLVSASSRYHCSQAGAVGRHSELARPTSATLFTRDGISPMTQSKAPLIVLVLLLAVLWPPAVGSPAERVQRRLPPTGVRAIKRVPVEEKLVALTLDDGPDPEYTPLVLKLARDRGVPLTFFLMGRHVQQHPDLARQVAAEGHAIGNHTFSHTIMVTQDAAEIRRYEKEIEQACGHCAHLFRPPRGRWDRNVVRAATQLGYDVVLWEVALEHHEVQDAEAMAARVAARVRPGSIIVAHDGWPRHPINRDQTIRALPMLIDELQKQGYRFVTVPELLAHRRSPQATLARPASAADRRSLRLRSGQAWMPTRSTSRAASPRGQSERSSRGRAGACLLP